MGHLSTVSAKSICFQREEGKGKNRYGAYLAWVKLSHARSGGGGPGPETGPQEGVCPPATRCCPQGQRGTDSRDHDDPPSVLDGDPWPGLAGELSHGQHTCRQALGDTALRLRKSRSPSGHHHHRPWLPFLQSSLRSWSARVGGVI